MFMLLKQEVLYRKASGQQIFALKGVVMKKFCEAAL